MCIVCVLDCGLSNLHSIIKKLILYDKNCNDFCVDSGDSKSFKTKNIDSIVSGADQVK